MSIIRYVDHVSTTVDDAEGALSLFRDTLGLAAAWPLHDYGTFKSAGVQLGNMKLEVCQPEGGSPEGPSQWITLAPATIAGLLGELDNRGLRHGPEETFEGPVPPDGDIGLLTTTVRLTGDFAGRCGVRLSVYDFDNHDHPAQPSPANPLDIAGVERLRVGAADLVSGVDIWQRLLVPTLFDGEAWRFDRGPDISIEACGDNELIGLVVRVGSIDRAVDALDRIGIDENAARLHDDGIGLAGIRFFLTD